MPFIIVTNKTFVVLTFVKMLMLTNIVASFISPSSFIKGMSTYDAKVVC